MAPLIDSERLAAYQDALGNWNFAGYVSFQLTEQAYRWIRLNLGDITLKELSRLMHEFVADGGKIDEQPETRPEWSEFDFHYDLRFSIDGVPVYVETRLNWRRPVKPDESSIVVVNVHAP